MASTSYSSEARSSRVGGSSVHSPNLVGEGMYLRRCSRLKTGCIEYVSGSLSLYTMGLIFSTTSKGPIIHCMSFLPVPVTSTSSRV